MSIKKTLYFATGNKGKIESLKNYFKSLNYEINIQAIDLDLIEPQENSVKEVSITKAKQAFEKLKKPVIVNDGGVCIEALNGFPGVYTKYICHTIGAKGILKLLENEKNRNAYFQSTTSFVNEKGEIFNFENQISKKGVILHKEDNTPCPNAWSEIWKIYGIPDLNKGLVSLTNKELDNYFGHKDKESMRLFIEWYIEQNL